MTEAFRFYALARRGGAGCGCEDLRAFVDIFAEPLDRGLATASLMGNVQGVQGNFDHTECPEHHWGVDMPHMRDAEGLAKEITDPDTKHDAAFLIAIVKQLTRITTIVHENSRYRVGAFARFDDIETKCPAPRPDLDGATGRLGEQAVTQKDVGKPFKE
jgi:hypothetical protein